MAKCYPIFVFACLLLATNLSAAIKTWIGPDEGSWNNAANWSPAGVPSSVDDVEISGFWGAILIETNNPTVHSLQVINGADVTFRAEENNRQITVNCIACGSGIESGSTATFTGTPGYSNRSCSLKFFSSPAFSVDGTLIFTGSSSSILYATNATVTVNGSLIFDGDGNASLVCTGGTTTVNGEIIYTGGGSTTATASNLFISNNATYEIAKNGGMVPNANWATSSTLRISGMTTTSPTFVDGAVLGNFWWECAGQTAPADFNVDLTMNRMDIFGTGSSEIRLNAANGNHTRTWTINGEYTQNGGIVNLSSSNNGIGKINFKGSNFYGLMTITESSSNNGKGIIEFCGSQPQLAYFGNLNNTIDIVINTADRVLLNTPLTINPGATLTLTTGKVVTTAAYLLTITNGATVVGGNVSSHILGPMRKIGNTAFVFPIGKNTTYAPMAITAPSAPTDTFVAEYFHNAYSNTTNVTSPLVRVSTIEHWKLVRNSGSSSVKVTLHWQNGPASGINDLASLAVARFDGSSWVDMGGLTAGTQMTGSIQSDLVSAYDWFTFGSRSANFNPLPIELISFSAVPLQEEVRLDWATATEKNNAYFAIERSADGQVFAEIGRAPGAGNASLKIQYRFSDAAPKSGLNYYRLRQVDFDGLFSYSPVRMANWVGGRSQEVVLYPLPAKEVLWVSLAAAEPADGEWQIRNSAGQLVLSGHWVSGERSWSVPVATLSNGTYFIQFAAGQQVWSRLFVKSTGGL